MQILRLEDHPEWISTLAAWHQQALWPYNPQRTVEERIERLGRHLGPESIPATFVAVENGAPLGSAALVAEDLPTRPEFSPWLAAFCVAPENRSRGIGAALVARVVDEARRLGFPRLYLYTLTGENYYARLGWRTVEHTLDHHGQAIALMAHELSSAAIQE